jgi:hypothetical protein
MTKGNTFHQHIMNRRGCAWRIQVLDMKNSK